MIETHPLGDVGVAVLDCEHKTPPEADAGYPYIAIPDIQDGRIDISASRRVSRAHLEEWTKRTRPVPGDLVVTRRGRVGDSAPIPVDRCAIGQNLVILRSDGKQVDQRFLRWACRSPLWWREVDRFRNVGAVFSSLNVRDISRMSIPVPSLAVQGRIAEVLGALDDKIAANRRVVAAARELGISLMRASALEPLPLSEIAKVTMGTSPKGELLNEGGAGLPFFQGVRDFGPVYPNERIYTEHPVRTARAGSVLFAVRAPVGKTNLALGETAIGRGLAGIHSADQPATLYFAMKAFESIWDEFDGSGTVFASVNASQVRSAVLPMPAVSEARTCEGQLAPLLERMVAAERESERLAATRDELLPLLMSGKITVKDAEREIESDAGQEV